MTITPEQTELPDRASMERHRHAPEVFQVSLLTGLLSGGATRDHLDHDALRPPSLRGGLRYWYRALAGGMGLDIAAEERALFGSTAASSLFSLEILPVTTPKIDWMSIRADAQRDHNSLGRNGVFAGAAHPFRCQARFLFRPRCQPCQREAVLAAWRVFAMLGGDGMRKRRGRGSFVITDREWHRPCDCRSLADIAQAYVAEVTNAREAIKRARSHATSSEVGDKDADRLPILEAANARIWLMARRNDALDDGEEFRRHVYGEVYGALKVPPVGRPEGPNPRGAAPKDSIGRGYAHREGALPSPLLFTIKQVCLADSTLLTYAVIIAWHHRTHAARESTPYFGTQTEPWSKLEAALSALTDYELCPVL